MTIEERVSAYTGEHSLSDLHIHAGRAFSIRVTGEIVTFSDDVVAEDELSEFINTHLESDEMRSAFANEREADLAIEIDGRRYRANFFYTSTGQAVVMRKIEEEIPSMSDLNLPPVVQDMANQPNGLILVTGPTGSGKTTSLAAMVDHINENRKEHILTIEDPIEYVHHNKKCIVAQREVGRDTKSFANALRAALREDPDVILVGELRDLETIQLALTAAETGHLVFGTLHTSGAPNTINRIIDVFPPEQQGQVRSQISQSLRMVMTQKLFRKIGGGRIAAFEVMVCNPAVRNLIRENKIFQIESIMQTARADGMVTMDAAIQQLAGQVSPEDLAG